MKRLKAIFLTLFIVHSFLFVDAQSDNLGIKTIVHQNQVIGSYTMIGMGTIITKKKIISPGYIYYGKPVKLIRKNNFIIKKLKIDENNLIKETQRFKKIKKEI